jgi:tetratricopeptide (TPR) repeat protein
MADVAFDLYRQGLRLHRAKDYDGAIKLLEQAVAAEPTLADAWEALGVLYDKQLRLDDAIAATEKFVALKPDEVMAHTNLSRFFMKKGLKEKAEEEQGKARLIGWKHELAEGGAKEIDLKQAETKSEEPPQLVSMIGGLGAPAVPSAGAPLASGPAALQK